MNTNRQGRYFRYGISLDTCTRGHIICLFEDGKSYTQIASEIKVTRSTVSNIVNNYLGTGSYLVANRRQGSRQIMTNTVLNAVEFYTTSKPSIYAKEIQK